MTEARDIQIKDYWYDLPDSQIAEFPLENRDQSKLLVYKRGNEPQQYLFNELPDHLPDQSLLILNDTRVIHARLLFQKISGACIEIFCLSPVAPTREMQSAFGVHSPVVWECLVGNSRRWKEGSLSLVVDSPEGKIVLTAERLSFKEIDGMKVQSVGNQLIRFSWTPSQKSFSSIIELFGTVPLPPYIHRDSQESDNLRYQTVYAREEGSVAAPTAGLHFTPFVFNALKNKGIDTAYLTLHVGAGTFKPVTTDTVGEHAMHAEPFTISLEFLEYLLANVNRPFIAVGTTSVRTLESLYLAGLRLLNGAKTLDDLLIQQWEPYQQFQIQSYTKSDILHALVNYLKRNEVENLNGSTQLLIAPGFRFGLVDGMVTNFHQPGSTLLLLISAFLGEEWKNIYKYALKQDFRFLSYGDSCLFL